MRPALAIAALLIALGLTLLAPRGAVYAQSGPVYVVIVHPSNPSTTVERKFVADAFLKKTTRWPHGEAIRPADLAADSPVRRRFTEDVHKRSVAEVRPYWQQIIFSGRDLPPPELGTDEEVVKFVLRYPGAIGYIAGGASLGGARAVVIR